MPETTPFSISRVLKAPSALVFKVYSEPGHLEKWMSPAGFKVIKADMDLRPGGTYHYGLGGPNGMEMWGKWKIREIDPPRKLVYVQSFSDKDGGITAHPMSPTWPREMLTTSTFEDLGGQTKLTITWTPLHAGDDEIKTFDGARGNMSQGWEGTFVQLEAYLAEIQK
jgi:uncharacterized protein YndB with AHSA1/START domain